MYCGFFRTTLIWLWHYTFYYVPSNIINFPQKHNFNNLSKFELLKSERANVGVCVILVDTCLPEIVRLFTVTYNMHSELLLFSPLGKTFYFFSKQWGYLKTKRYHTKTYLLCFTFIITSNHNRLSLLCFIMSNHFAL